MSGVDLQLDRRFTGRLLASREVQEAVEQAAQPVLAAARAGAPIATGDYQGSIDMVSGVVKGRAKARVGTSDPGGVIIEQRTGNLRSALESL